MGGHSRKLPFRRRKFDSLRIRKMPRATRRGKHVVAEGEEGETSRSFMEQFLRQQEASNARQDAILAALQRNSDELRTMQATIEAQRLEVEWRFAGLEAQAAQQAAGDNNGDNNGNDDGDDGGPNDDGGAQEDPLEPEEVPSEGEAELRAPSFHASTLGRTFSPPRSVWSEGGSWRAGGSRFELSRHAKMELECFKGELDPDKLTSWLIKLDQYFDIHDVPEYAKLKIMETKLDGHALLWWQCLKSAPNYSTPTWTEFMRIAKKKFMPFDVEAQLFKDFYNHKQGGTTVKEYADKLMELTTKMGVDESEATQVMCFMNGLNYSIQREMELLELPTLDRAYQVALKVEARMKRGKDVAKGGGQGSKSSFAKGGGAGSHQASGGQKEGQGTSGGPKPQGSTNQGGGRGAASSRGRGGGSASQGRGSGRGSNQSANRGPKAPIVCYKCDQEGHKSFECPNRGSNQAQATQPVVEAVREEVNPNVRILVLANTQSKGGFQRKRVFYTRATISGSK